MAKGRKNGRGTVILFCLIMLLAVDVVLAVQLMGKKESQGSLQGEGSSGTPDDTAIRPGGNNTVLGGGKEEVGTVPDADKEEGSIRPDGNREESGAKADQRAAELLANMTIEQKVAQMFMITPEALTGYTKVTAADEVTKQSFLQYPVGGIIYMANNLVNPEQTRAMLSNMSDYSMELAKIPIFLGVDEEGGTVARIARNEAFGIGNVGNMSEIGASQDCGKAREAGRTIGVYLAELGFNLDFAPVADVWSNEKNTVVKYRSFGSDAALVRDMVAAQIEGLKGQGILSVVKHFPGHGSTAEDSHKGAAVVDKSLQELRDCDLIPFEGAIAAGVPFVMVGHLSLPQVAGSEVPAVLSEEIIGNLLRKELGFEGIVITDALDMDAITDYYSPAEAAVMAVEAGADMLLMPEDFTAAYQGVLDAVQDGRLTQERIDMSVLRILKVKVRMGE